MAKAPANIKSLARKHTTEAIERLAFWMRSDNAKASVGACIALLDRGWGKASQPLTNDSDQPFKVEYVSAREALLSRLSGIESREEEVSGKLN